jgi:hypothetical protein
VLNAESSSSTEGGHDDDGARVLQTAISCSRSCIASKVLGLLLGHHAPASVCSLDLYGEMGNLSVRPESDAEVRVVTVV